MVGRTRPAEGNTEALMVDVVMTTAQYAKFKVKFGQPQIKKK